MIRLIEVWYFLAYQYIAVKSIIQGLIWRHFHKKSEFPRRTGEVAVITGGGRGIGLEVVRQLLAADMHVILGVRNVKSVENAVAAIRDGGMTGGKTEVRELDMMSSKSIRKFASKLIEENKPIKVLINNAGIMFVPYRESEDGFESQMAVNYFGHFLLVHLLLPLLRASGTSKQYSRIVNLSSCAHLLGKIDLADLNLKKDYVSEGAYAQSKLAQNMFTKMLDAKLRGEGAYVQTNSVHPGIVNTELFDDTWVQQMMPRFIKKATFKSAEEGATVVTYTALSPEIEGQGGTYINNCEASPENRLVNDIGLSKKLWDKTCELLYIQEFGVPEKF